MIPCARWGIALDRFKYVAHSGQSAVENTYVNLRVAERCRKKDPELK